MIRQIFPFTAALALLGGSLSFAQSAKPPSQIDRSTLHVQVVLDKLGFAPGPLDGKGGQSLRAALKGYQTSSGLKLTGEIDTPTLRSLHRYRAWRPTVALRLDAASLAGPFFPQAGKDPAAQAKMPALGYRNVMESLAERFHTTPETLIALNSPQTRLTPGTRIIVPNALRTSRDYESSDPKWRATLDSLNVSADVPKAARVLIDESDGVLRVYDTSEKLVAQFPATMGSSADPLPIGRWKVNGLSFNPDYSYDPKLIRGSGADAKKATLPPGPNSPVGVVWIDLSKPHYGIHGTPEPHLIGRTESNGCIRLSNWDAARLALMVKPGTPVVMQR